MALWRGNGYVLCAIGLFSVAQWGLSLGGKSFSVRLFWGVLIKVNIVSISVLLIDWRGMIIPCNGVFPNSVHGSPAIIALYFYSECLVPHSFECNLSILFWVLALIWDCFILVLTVLGLWRQNAARSTRLWTVLFRQGVGFLVITSAVNILMLVSLLFPLS